MKIGIIKEGKTPPDSRVVLTPGQCAFVKNNFPVEILVQPSQSRCYTDEEYAGHGIAVVQDISHCDVLLGVKEVPVSQLIPGRTYFFFSHTVKKQPQNRRLLQAILEKRVTLIDFEVLKDEKGNRLIAFGHFAGMVGAHNALWTFSKRTGSFQMRRMKEFRDYEAARKYYGTLHFPPLKIVLTGTGRVATGAKKVLEDMGIKGVAPESFLTGTFTFPVYTQIDCLHYAARKDGKPFAKKDFYEHPKDFKSAFADYYKAADAMINGIYWNENAPAFFTNEEMRSKDFKIKIIADVTCDIAPNASIPATLRASSIEDPIFGYNPKTGKEVLPFADDSIDMMAIDNLPNELPRDASHFFGNQFIENILPELVREKSAVIEAATVAENGYLKGRYCYLEDYVSASLVS